MSNNMQWLAQALKMEVMHLPIMIISLAAMAMAIVRWRQAPRACLFCLLGFGIVLCASAGMPFLQYFLIFGPARSSPGSMSVVMAVFSVTWSLLNAGAYVMLALAVFAGRSKPAQV